jgi:1-acyl-sn-glycerol-3-phosphate acyltransferase
VVKTFVTWGNIVEIAILLMILGWIMYLFVPIRKKRKEYWFHWMFSKLSRAYIAFTFAWARRFDNPQGEDFTLPGIIISNHQSLIETPAFLRLYPRIIILTTTWVHNSPVFGPIAHLANFSNVENGIDNIIEELRERVREGFSILIFPEGHRSEDHKIHRFHRGAFYLAEKLQVDIIPLMVFGSGDFLPKDTFWGRPNELFMRVLPRVAWNDPAFGTDYSVRSKKFRQFYIREYARYKSEEGTARYYRQRLILNYVFKGPIIEWYLKTKLRLEKNYQVYCDLLPKKGEILDLGCGYGYVSYMLAFTSEERVITGVDYDAVKIRVAENCYDKTDRITFTCADASEYDITPRDGFLLSDVLHYLSPEKQEHLLRRCMENLNNGGVILVREANAELAVRHKKSRLTEFLSTHIGFNKTMESEKRLHFTSAEKIRSIASEYGMSMRVIDHKKVTSNNIFVLTREPGMNGMTGSIHDVR